jgi:acetylglutamate kinase
VIVVKVGGAVVDAAELGELEDAVVVHGAGPQITAAMAQAGLSPTFVGGRRVTDEAALPLVRETLLRVNRGLCAAIGPRAVGFAGDEIGLEATRVPELGHVGTPVPSRPQAILDALEAGLVPVVAPIAVGPLNVNADEAAAALAAGLGAERLIFVSDVPGVYVDGGVAEQLRADAADELLAAGAFEGGIVPKLLAAARAARLGIAAEIGETAVIA